MDFPRPRRCGGGSNFRNKAIRRAAFALFSRAARANIPEAEFRVGRCYLEGSGVPPSRADGVRWVERAAEKGYVEAQALLATLCLHGMAPGFADAGPGPAPACSAARPSPSRIIPAPPSGPGGPPRLDRPTARRCWAFILTSGPETLRNIEEGDRWYREIRRRRLPAGAAWLCAWCWRAIPANPAPRKNCFAI